MDQLRLVEAGAALGRQDAAVFRKLSQQGASVGMSVVGGALHLM